MSDHNIFVGGNISNSSLAQGSGASAGPVSAAGDARQQVALLLDEFIASLAGYQDGPSGVRDMRALAESARSELTVVQPDKGRIESLLNGIKALLSATGSAVLRISDLAVAIDNIRAAVGHL